MRSARNGGTMCPSRMGNSSCRRLTDQVLSAPRPLPSGPRVRSTAEQRQTPTQIPPRLRHRSRCEISQAARNHPPPIFHPDSGRGRFQILTLRRILFVSVSLSRLSGRPQVHRCFRRHHDLPPPRCFSPWRSSDDGNKPNLCSLRYKKEGRPTLGAPLGRLSCSWGRFSRAGSTRQFRLRPPRPRCL